MAAASPDLCFQVDTIETGSRERPATSMIVTANGARFSILLLLENLRDGTAEIQDKPSQLEFEYLEILDRLNELLHGGAELDADADDEYDELCNWLFQPCRPVFVELTSSTSVLTRRTIEEYFKTDTFTLHLVNKDGKLTAVHMPDIPSNAKAVTVNFPASHPAFSGVPRIKATAVNMLPYRDEDLRMAVLGRVSVDGDSQYFFKTGLCKESFLREVSILQRIMDANLPKELHTTRLHSIVETSDGLVVGMIMNHIESPHNLWNVTAANPEFSLSMRRKWMKQVRHIVGQLHDAGIIWGDVHPGNVLIDTKGDAWVVDFGGGCCTGWVDIEYCETIAGDFQGLMKLEKHMGLEHIRETILPTQKVLRYFAFCWWIAMVFLLKNTAYLA